MGTSQDPKDTKKQLAAVTALFKTLDVEEALVKALPQVLGRKPEDRGGFDDLSLKHMEENFDNHLTALSGKIEAVGLDVSDADVAAIAWDATVEVAQDKLEESKASVAAEEAKLAEFQTAVATARKILKEQASVVKKNTATLGMEQVGLQDIEDVLSALEFLA